MARLTSAELDRRIRIQRPAPDDSFDGAGSGTWDLVTEVWANIQDALPSRGERLAEGINVATRPSRVRIRYCSGIDSTMRAEIGHYADDENGAAVWMVERTVQLVTEPAELGRREGLEFMVEEHQPAGNAA